MNNLRAEFDPVGLVGLGFLGRGIAASLLGAGLQVIAVDPRKEAQQQAGEYIDNALREMVSNGLAPTTGDSWSARLSVSHSIDTLKPCRFVIESVVENLEIKSRLFDEVEAFVGAEVPIASNTSALPITALQEGRKHPSRFLGMHWCEPAYATRFLEVIRGNHTSDDSVNIAMALARRIGKDPCVVNHDIPGFIVNRLAYAMYREAAYLVELGVADAATIDRAFRNACGLWATLCGPFRWIDITGGPVLYAQVMQDVLPTLCNNANLPPVFAEKQQSNERGTGNGSGFYKYGPGDAAHWQELLHEHAWQVRRLQDRYDPLRGD
jgi:3-hydroxybutyryl-CoA dehydrogenase